MYHDIFKNRIGSGNYQLADIQHRIKKLYALGDLTEEEMDELLLLSQKNATADMERPEVLQMLRNLTERVAALEKSDQEDHGDAPAVYEVWSAWDGISDKYQNSTVVSHKGKLWISVFPGQNVWEPGAIGTEHLWNEYVEEVAENV